MLVLQRKPNGPGVIIDRGGKEIRIQIIRLPNGKLALGIEAPREIPVVREELPPLEPSENKAAA